MRLTVLPVLGVVMLSWSCDDPKPLKLQPPPGCRAPEVVECLQPYSSSTLDSNQIERLWDEGAVKCFAQKDPKRLTEQASCLPLVMGKAKQGHSVRLTYGCPHVWLEFDEKPILYQAAKGSEPCPFGGPLLR